MYQDGRSKIKQTINLPQATGDETQLGEQAALMRCSLLVSWHFRGWIFKLWKNVLAAFVSAVSSGRCAVGHGSRASASRAVVGQLDFCTVPPRLKLQNIQRGGPIYGHKILGTPSETHGLQRAFAAYGCLPSRKNRSIR
jgi:hypothetical protein